MLFFGCDNWEDRTEVFLADGDRKSILDVVLKIPRGDGGGIAMLASDNQFATRLWLSVMGRHWSDAWERRERRGGSERARLHEYGVGTSRARFMANDRCDDIDGWEMERQERLARKHVIDFGICKFDQVYPLHEVVSIELAILYAISCLILSFFPYLNRCQSCSLEAAPETPAATCSALHRSPQRVNIEVAPHHLPSYGMKTPVLGYSLE